MLLKLLGLKDAYEGEEEAGDLRKQWQNCHTLFLPGCILGATQGHFHALGELSGRRAIIPTEFGT